MPAPSPLQREQLCTLAEAAAWVRDRSGRKTHLATLHRWALRGCRGRRLETLLIGRQRMTSKEALHRFFEAESPAVQPAAPATPPPASPAAPAPLSAARDVEELHARLFRSSKAH